MESRRQQDGDLQSHWTEKSKKSKTRTKQKTMGIVDH